MSEVTPTFLDLARNLQADYEAIIRDPWGWCAADLHKIACPALRRALAAEAERDQLRERVKALGEEVDYYHDFLAREQACALATEQQLRQEIADLQRRLDGV